MSNQTLKHGQKVEIRSFENPNMKVTAIFCSYELRKGKAKPQGYENIPDEDCFIYKTKDGFKFFPLSKFYTYKGPSA